MHDRKLIRVLVVDDYHPLADNLAKAMRAEGYTAMAVYSGEEALRIAEEFSPDALISDIMMPGMSGIDLVLAFAEKFPRCRSLLMTSDQSWSETTIGGLRIKVLRKPFEFEEIFAFLENCRK